MRLLDSQTYRGKQISVYVIYPVELGRAALPLLGVRVDGRVIEDKPLLADVSQLLEALTWGRRAVDRLLGTNGVHEPMFLPAPV